MKNTKPSVPKRIPFGVALSVLLVARPLAFGWGREGHHVTVMIAARYMTPATAARVQDLLGSESVAEASVWADEYRRSHPETGPWHYIDIPLADDKIDLARDCPHSDCVIAKTEQFVAVLRDPNADKEAKAQALRFVIHFVGDLHQPLHTEDNGDKGGNTRQVMFDGHPDNLHWLWDTGLLEHINRDPQALATVLEGKITSQQRAEWVKGSIEDWVLEGHRLAQSVAYGDLGSQNPAVIGADYERQAEPVIKTQLEKAGGKTGLFARHGFEMTRFAARLGQACGCSGSEILRHLYLTG